MKKIIICIILLFMIVGCSSNNNKKDLASKYKGSLTIVLDGNTATIDGEEIKSYDYTWHIDPSQAHEDVKDSPAEYYTGTKPEGEDIYIDHELYYYPLLDESKFKSVNYDGEKEYVYYYEDGENNEYIFSTLPNFRNFPSNMMHSEAEASEYLVLHINKAGTYILEGSFLGQINVDLGEEAFNDPEATVTFVLNGVDVECGVAPAFIVENAYECDNTWEEDDRKEAIDNIDNAGVKVIVADNTVNNFTGANIYRMLKTKYKNEESDDKVQKKARKYDAPFYSCVSMTIDGEESDNGVLNITSTFEGLDTELHLAINGATININSQDDGINVNEDNVSVLFINGGTTTLNAGLGQEGDGIDSNGYVVLNGGKLYINDIEAPDNYVDSEDGITYNGGEIYLDNQFKEITVGTTLKEIGNEMMGGFGGPGQNQPFNFGDIDISEIKKKVASLSDDATINDLMEILGNNNEFGTGMPRGEEFNQNQEPPQGMPNDMPQNGERFGDVEINIKEIKEKVAALDDTATIQDIMEIFGMNKGFNGGERDMPQERPDGNPPQPK